MAGNGLKRTDYWNRATGTVRGGATQHDETVTDIEDFVLPHSQAGTAGLHLWGIATGLSVTGSPNQPALRVSPGSAIDAVGHLIVLAAGGFAVVDPDIDPDDIAHIPTVAVDTTGLSLSTANHTGERYLTIRYLEVSVEGLLGSDFTVLHAPWLRLVDSDDFSDDGADVVLAHITLASGSVTALSTGLRRLTGAPAERLQLRRPTTTTGASLIVDQLPAAELRARLDGGVVLDVLQPSSGPATALIVDAAGRVGIGAEHLQRPLHVEGSQIHTGGSQGGLSFADRNSDSFVENPDAGQRWVWYAQDGTARLWSGADRLSIAANGNIGIGVNARQAQRPLHVEGSEIHSGGGTGGFSFADRTTGPFVEAPDAGQRWVWYAQGGVARLWSGTDRLSVSPTAEGGGLDVGRRMRVRQGGDSSAGIWFFQDAQGDRGFVGMADDTHIGFWGNTGAGWGVTMDTSSGQLNANRGLNVTGTAGFFQPAIRAAGQVGVQAEGTIGISATSTTGSFAGLFNGDVRVIGTLTKTSLNFEIDHPVDPGNKLLRHSAIESDEMKNVYDGVVQLDSQGRAEVVLPDWFEALNENFRYQLTPVGAAAPNLHIAEEMHEGRFVIDGGPPGSKVCWQVSGVRHDAYAKAHPLQVEILKSPEEVGLFVHPEEHDEPATRSLATLLMRPGGESMHG